jgi:predicted small secreted protein
MKRIICALIGAAFLAGLAGCNTMAGIGEDTQAAGKKIENSADRNKRY